MSTPIASVAHQSSKGISIPPVVVLCERNIASAIGKQRCDRIRLKSLIFHWRGYGMINRLLGCPHIASAVQHSLTGRSQVRSFYGNTVVFCFKFKVSNQFFSQTTPTFVHFLCG